MLLVPDTYHVLRDPIGFRRVAWPLSGPREITAGRSSSRFFVVYPPQQILSCSNKDIFILLHASAIKNEVESTSNCTPSSFLIRIFEIRWRARGGGIFDSGVL
jgi:hypothetical protein